MPIETTEPRSNLQRVPFLPSAARTADGRSESVDLTRATFHGFTAVLNVTAVSGSAPSLDVFIQQELPDGSFHDFARFTQVTTTTKRVLLIANSGVDEEVAAQDRAMVAGTVRGGIIGGLWRVGWLISGVVPSFTFSLDADFFEFV